MSIFGKSFTGLFALALLGGCGRVDAPVSIAIPADPHAPVIAHVSIGRNVHPLVVDTGSHRLVLDLAVASRLYPQVTEGEPPPDAVGLHGDMPQHRFLTGPLLRLGDWQLQTDGSVLATDLSALVAETGAHGVLGMAALSGRNWLWDNRRHQLLGYRPGDARFASAIAAMQCRQMRSYDGIPGVKLDVANGNEGIMLLDTGDLLASGGLSREDAQTLAQIGAVAASFPPSLRLRDVGGADLGELEMTRVQGLKLGEVALDGLLLHAQQDASRLGRGFFARFDRLALDFEGFRLCLPAGVTAIDPDDPAPYR